MSNALATQNQNSMVTTFGYDREQVDLIKTTIAKGCTDDELRLFMATAQRLQLDPFARQIYAVKRFDRKEERDVMSIQVGIDGLRSSADRTGLYAPGGDHEFSYNAEGLLVKATATVRKFSNGSWLECRRSAFWDEYVQLDKARNPTPMWRDKPHVMLGKCAEAQALRAAFPQLGGAYIPEEMQQGQPDAVVVEAPAPRPQARQPLPVAAYTTPEQPHPAVQKVKDAFPGTKEDDWSAERLKALMERLIPGVGREQEEARLDELAKHMDYDRSNLKRGQTLYKVFSSGKPAAREGLIKVIEKMVELAEDPVPEFNREPGGDDE